MKQIILLIFSLLLICSCVLTKYTSNTTNDKYLLYNEAINCSKGKYLSSGKCVTCPKGSYCINNKKTVCAKGTYQDKTGQYKCISCSISKTTKTTGSKSSSDCITNVKCTLNITNDRSEITVKANDTKKIKGYRYRYGKTTTDLLTNNKYTLDTLDNKASVLVYNNDNKYYSVTCKVVDKSTTQKRSYKKETYGSITYMLYKPKMSLRKNAPLVIYYYGAAGLSSGLPKNLSTGADLPYYVVIPIGNKNLNTIMNLVSYLTETYKIDTDRIFVSGGSAGSPTALKLAAKYSNSIAGVIIVAGMSETINIEPNTLKKRPIWFFQGSSDSHSMINNYVNKINKAGGNAKITWYTGGHSAPNDAFLRRDLTDWILKTKKQ